MSNIEFKIRKRMVIVLTSIEMRPRGRWIKPALKVIAPVEPWMVGLWPEGDSNA